MNNANWNLEKWNTDGVREGRRPFLLLGKSVEEPILPKIVDGDSAAFQKMVDRFGGLVWTLASKALRNRADVEDATQEIMTEIWRSASRYNEKIGSEVTFVTVIARRRLWDRLRKMTRRPAPVSLPETPLESSSADPANAALVSDEAGKALKLLEQLKPEEQKVLRLAVFEKMTQGEISNALSMPLGTVKSHASRGMKKLRSLMESSDVSLMKGGLQ